MSALHRVVHMSGHFLEGHVFILTVARPASTDLRSARSASPNSIWVEIVLGILLHKRAKCRYGDIVRLV